MGNERARRRRKARKLKKEKKQSLRSRKHTASSENLESAPGSTQLLSFRLPLPGTGGILNDATCDMESHDDCSICAALPEPPAYNEQGFAVTPITEEQGKELTELLIAQAETENGMVWRNPKSPWYAARDDDEDPPPRRCPPDREAALLKIERTLSDAEFPYSREELERLFRKFLSGSVFDTLRAPIENTTSPLVEALVDLWNHTPRPTLCDHSPIEFLCGFGDIADGFVGPHTTGETSIVRTAQFVRSLHNEAFVASLSLPPDPPIDKASLIAAIETADAAAVDLDR